MPITFSHTETDELFGYILDLPAEYFCFELSNKGGLVNISVNFYICVWLLLLLSFFPFSKSPQPERIESEIKNKIKVPQNTFTPFFVSISVHLLFLIFLRFEFKLRKKKNEFSKTFRKNSLYKFENLQEHGNNRYKKWYVECK